MLKNTSNLTALLIISIGLASCASGGGSAGLAMTTPSAAPPPSTTPVDNRHHFDSWTTEYSPGVDGFSSAVTHTFDMTEHTTTGLPAPTEKYKIADYGFFRSTINGHHAGYDYGNESSILNSFLQRGQVIRADLNGDGWQDFYLVMWAGDHDELIWEPDSLVFAFLNDGDGNFILSQELFPEGNPCFRGQNCVNAGHNKGVLVADFNGDGIDDIYHGNNMVLSDNGVFYNHNDRMPAELVDMCGEDFCWTHDAYASDVENDGDQDIFLPIAGASPHGFEIPWTMLLNDGTGNFTMNQNFPDATDSMFATTAAIADFDNDGFGDVAVGWFKPGDNPIFSQQYEHSAGAVFYNDGNNDWSVRAWVELPDNFYGANGNANDMEVFDFNGDGYIDIVLASTRRDPYYEGRMIQFFQNTGTSFTDVTAQYGDETFAYYTGSIWNGDGQLSIIDFDADGDLDIVDSVSGTYVLLNEGDRFSMYNDFPYFDDRSTYYPIEIDNKYFYDFIGATYSYSDDQSVATFFQVLDPPLLEMANEIKNKPSGFVNEIFRSKMMFTDLRKATRQSTLFGRDFENNNMFGYSQQFENFGFVVGRLEGNSYGSFAGVDYMFEDGLHVGFNYVQNTMDIENPTKWFGTGTADVDYQMFNTYTEWFKSLNDNWFTTFGNETIYTKVEGFSESNSNHNITVQGFSLLDFKLFADLTGKYYSKYGTTMLTFGVDHYQSMNDDKINFANNLMTYRFNEKLTVGKFSITHTFNNFYARASFNTEDLHSYEIGYYLKF